MVSDNMSLGRFRLDGIPPAPRGVPQVEVTFDIDANGILNVSARDKATGKEQKVAITASTNLNKAEIERMVQQGREHETEDRKRRELIEARNTADSLAYQTEKTLGELGDKMPASERQNIQEKVASLREVIKGEDTARIKQLTDDLQNAFHAISQQMYAQQAQQQQPADSASGVSGNGHGPDQPAARDDEGEVIEGEFREA
jgi:molecular chaperone DnaK